MKNTHNILRSLIERAECKPGWVFEYTETEEDGPVLKITDTLCRDAYSPDQKRSFPLQHSRPIPFATYNEATWREWLFQQCILVETHELGEWFRIDGQRPFPPMHGPGEDPYSIHMSRPEVDALTRQDGTVRSKP